MAWTTEVDELHAFFEAWFVGSETSMDRLESVLARDFTIVGPRGGEMDRVATIEEIRAARGHAPSLRISVSDHRLLLETDDVIVGRYVEAHQLTERINGRLSTVVFRRDRAAPNGLLWETVHETWIDPP